MKLKETKKVGSRGTLFTFDFGDSVFLINGEHQLYLCDTSIGTDLMDIVKEFISENKCDKKPIVIFNSHSDWDHIWGNDAFYNVQIIGHALCRKRMLERAEYDRVVLSGDGIKIRYPNLTFTELLTFEDDGVEFMYAPGHTIDSSICFDRVDKTLYVGDLLEKPIPCFMNHDLNQYLNTLEMLKQIDAKTIVTTHSNVVDSDLINEHILYIMDVINGKYLTYNSEHTPLLHARNLKNRLLFQFDDKMRLYLKDDFNFYQYRMQLWDFIKNRMIDKPKRIWDITNISYHKLNHLLEEFYEQTTDY